MLKTRAQRTNTIALQLEHVRSNSDENEDRTQQGQSNIIATQEYEIKRVEHTENVHIVTFIKTLVVWSEIKAEAM